jgi:CelD/BcsL family acetyltransferase involved in cellulose biosynthesis
VIELEPAETLPAEILSAAPYSCSPEWLRLCAEVYGQDLRLFLVKRNGEPAGGFACAALRSVFFGRRIVSMPFSDESGLWAGPGVEFSAAERAELAAALAAALDSLAAETGAGAAELHGAGLLAGDAHFRETSPYLRFVLDTTRPYPELRGRFDTNLIKNLRKADKTVAVREETSPEAFGGVYGIYLRQMRRFGSPPLPAGHFNRLMAAGMGRLFVASVGGRDAALLFALAGGGVFRADVNAGLPEFETFFPKVKLFDETIRLACAEGFRAYDFMRTRAGSGVCAHKAKWGGREEKINYFYRDRLNLAHDGPDPEQARYALPRLLLRLAPLRLLAAFGPAIRAQAGK